MRIALLGISGNVGSSFAIQALENGHVIVGLSRNPDAVKVTHHNLLIHRGEVKDYQAILSTVQGCDVVVSAVGSGSFKQARKPTTVYSDTAKVLVRAMKEAGVIRLVAISAGGINPSKDWPLVYKLIIHRMLKEMYIDMQRMEDIVKASSLKYLFIRPVRLVEGPVTGKYRTTNEVAPAKGMNINYGDVAHYMLSRIEADDLQSGGVGIGY